MKYAIILIGVIGILVSACDHTRSTSEHASHQAVAENLSIALDNGEKWKVNEEMIPHIKDQVNSLNAYLDSDGQNVYRDLAGELEAHNAKLISSCTMDGKSHEELHKWLHPHIELIGALKTTKNEEDAQVIISKLEKSFETYNTYFQ